MNFHPEPWIVGAAVLAVALGLLGRALDPERGA